MADALWPLAGLFLAAFSAATLLPGGSEAALLAMQALSDHSTLTLLVVASLGNILGSVLNYWIGRVAEHYRARKWFPVSPDALARGRRWYLRWGQWSVLLAWVPVIGDPITVMAGVMRMNFMRFVILVSLSKILRYVAVLGIFSLVG